MIIFSLPHPVNWTDLDTVIRTVDFTSLTSTCLLSDADQAELPFFPLKSPTGKLPDNDTPLLAGASNFFWKWMRRWFTFPASVDETDCIGDSVKVTQTIPIHGLGRVQYRGTEWSARTIGGKTHKPGDGATIRRVEGIILVVD